MSPTLPNAGGEDVSDGGDPGATCGVCWSTLENPTIDDTKTTDSVSNGSFVSHFTGLEPATTYYVRAYITNAVTTA